MYLNVSSRTDSKQPSLSDSLCVSSSSLHSRLQKLQSRFTWDLKEEDMDLENLSIRLQEQIDLQLGQQSAVALSYSFLAYVRYSKASHSERGCICWYSLSFKAGVYRLMCAKRQKHKLSVVD